MNQKIFRRRGLSIALAALFCAAALFLVSCDLPAGPGFGTGTLTLHLPEIPVQGATAQNTAAGSARSVLSNSFTGTLVYRLTLTGPGGTQTLEAGGGGTTISLSAGNWTVNVLAYAPGLSDPVGSGQAVITVVTGRNSFVRIPMRVDPAYEAGLTEIYIHTEADLRRVGTDFAINGSFITHFYLENDIVLTQPWTPLGDSPTAPFRAVFDGQGHSITIRSFSGPKVDGSNLSLGLFAFVDITTIRNLTIKYELGGPVDISGIGIGQGFTGGAAGRVNDTVFENVKVLGNFSVIKNDGPAGDLHIGGIAGYASGGAMGITNCHVSGGVHGYTSGASVYSGGIVGMASISDSMQTSSFTGIVSGDAGSGMCMTGGIVGMMENGQIISSYASARVEARGGTNVYAGGITGYIRSLSAGGGAITACYAWAQVKADGTSGTNAAGGITGYTNSSGGVSNVNTSYARGTVEAVDTGTYKYAGGIAGLNQGSIEHCIALNDIISSSTSSDVHGIAGTQTGSATYVSNYAASDILFSRAGFSTNTNLIGDVTYNRAWFGGQANQSHYDSAWNFSAAGDWKWIGGYDYPVLSWQTSPPADPAGL